jgi:hypothetical protein
LTNHRKCGIILTERGGTPPRKNEVKDMMMLRGIMTDLAMRNGKKVETIYCVEKPCGEYANFNTRKDAEVCCDALGIDYNCIIEM